MISVTDVATIISAAVAIVLALYTLLASRRNERELEQLRAQMSEKQAERDARRDYEYEARKRLYQEFEPLFFQFIDAARSARGRIYGIARSARQGNLAAGRSWLSQPDGYYTLSTAYSVFVPIVLGRLLQRRLTFVDLSLDVKIRNQYEVIRRLSRVLGHDHELAEQAPRLIYDPNHPDAKRLTQTKEEIYIHQGVFARHLDMLTEEFITRDGNEPPRCISFGEFTRLHQENEAVFTQRFSLLIDLFLDFHPRTRPVLWRILMAQCILYRWLFASVDSVDAPLTDQSLREPEAQRRGFDWRGSGDTTPDAQVLTDPFMAAETYLINKLIH